jgi:transcriptional regulator with XRE-family HTH domain
MFGFAGDVAHLAAPWEDLAIMTDIRKRPPLKKRMLGALLADQREAAGLTARAACEAAGMDPSYLSRIESGRTFIKATTLDTLLDLYAVTDKVTRRAAHGYCEDRCSGGWWQAYGDFPEALTDLAQLEGLADLTCVWGVQRLPGVLQTPAYAHQWISPSTPNERSRRGVMFRMARKASLVSSEGEGVTRAALPETLLRGSWGNGPHVRRDQLMHLLDLGEMSRVHVRVLPEQQIFKWAPSSDICLLRLPHPWRGAYHEDDITGGKVGFDSEVWQLYWRRFDQMWQACLSVEDSRNLIRGMIEEA